MAEKPSDKSLKNRQNPNGSTTTKCDYVLRFCPFFSHFFWKLETSSFHQSSSFCYNLTPLDGIKAIQKNMILRLTYFWGRVIEQLGAKWNTLIYCHIRGTCLRNNRLSIKDVLCTTQGLNIHQNKKMLLSL